MAREITIKYPLGGSVTLTIGNLYSVHGWNKNAFFRLVNVKENAKGMKIAVIATVKTGKMYEVWPNKLTPYKPPKERKIRWRYSGQQRY